nr:immunoglobulin light chain junction region [Macaca mulatta]MOW16686.1 immunoglobulin light chain junction region [Macaca mulatta]MOW16829.1 immunoglobulin light chain junction region [Macaca mulatta]MOW17023.1 immunoglobulin light chain junction region [Macaca mulatta]MOW17138.1 immunoglobulin light chain junction region [Macaca mulatta]
DYYCHLWDSNSDHWVF